MICKNSCMQWAPDQRPYGSPYEAGLKWCTECETYLQWAGRYCPCCGAPLRTKPKSGRAKNSAMRQAEIEASRID